MISFFRKFVRYEVLEIDSTPREIEVPASLFCVRLKGDVSANGMELTQKTYLFGPGVYRFRSPSSAVLGVLSIKAK